MNTEQLQTIGPWGYLFAFVAAVLAIALTRLLMSDPQRTINQLNSKLRKVEKELDDARDVIAELKGERLRWTQHAEEQKRTIEIQENEIRDLQYARDTLKEAVRLKDETITLQREIIERGERTQKEQVDKMEWLRDRVIALDAERGVVTKWPWNP